MPACLPRSATALGRTCLPRPAGASGLVRTAATVWDEASSASSDGTAACGVPAKTSRIGLQPLAVGEIGRNLHCGNLLAPPVGRPDPPHRQLALVGIETVNEQHAIQMIGLVLHAPREHSAPLKGDRLAVHVETLGDDPV